MAFRGRIQYVNSDVVRNPPQLPIPMESGQIDWSVNFQGFPSGSLKYENIPESDISRFESAYNPKSGERRISIYGVVFIVDAYSYSRVMTVIRDSIQVNIYSVDITLKSAIEERIGKKVKVFSIVSYGAKSISVAAIAGGAGVGYAGPSISIPIPVNSERDYAISLSDVIDDVAKINGCCYSYSSGVVQVFRFPSGRTWNLAIEEFVQDGANTLRRAIKGVKDAELTWDNQENNLENPDEPPVTPVQTFRRKEPVVITLVEEDEDVESPPEGTSVLRTLDSTSDNSSPKKVKKISKQVNGSAVSEETEVWGFEYTAEDIHAGDGIMFSNSPEAFWKKIEYQKTEYIYETIPSLALDITVKDVGSGQTSLSDRTLTLLLHPDYQGFASYDGGFAGGFARFSSNAQYLTKIVTRGWKRLRFKKEPDDPNENTIALTEDKNEDEFAMAMWKLYQYKEVPFESANAFKLVSANGIYGDNASQPFSVEWVNFDDLEKRLKDLIDPDYQVTKDGKVGILYPDPNYVEPLSIVTETKTNSSFAFTSNPESEEDSPQPPYITGEESYYRVDRTVMSPSLYKEKTTEFSSQNSGFLDIGEKISFKDISGRLPEATAIKPDWEKNELSANQDAYNPSIRTTRYFVSYGDPSISDEGGSKSVSLASSLGEALAAVRTEIRIQQMQQDQCQRSVFTFYPGMRDGDRVVSGGDRYANKGTLVIMSASWSLKFHGNNNDYGLTPMCLAEPTSITLGLSSNPGVSVRSETDTQRNPPQQRPGEPRLIVRGGRVNVIGQVLSNSPNRRRF
jgi:hypothetical protein